MWAVRASRPGRWRRMSSTIKMEASTHCFPRVIDAHCHLQDARLRGHLGDVLRRAEAANVSHVATCACFEDDWRALEQLLSDAITSSDSDEQDVARDEVISSSYTRNNVQILPSFGVHPWWANATSPDYLALLRSRLERHASALLGEIGLCKSARGKQVDLAIQERVFREQLRLAAELQRGCVIHCVGAHGKLLEILKQHQRENTLPPVVVLHSYSGPADLVAAFLALQRAPHGARFKVFFSLNAKQLANAAVADMASVNVTPAKNPTPSKSEAACAKVPLDALLLETDAPDQAPVSSALNDVFASALLGETGMNEPALVQLALRGAAAIHEMPVTELASIVYENACRAFGVENVDGK